MNASGFGEGFKVCGMHRSGSPDDHLPVSTAFISIPLSIHVTDVRYLLVYQMAHTCFFQLDLPAYSSLEVTEKKVFTMNAPWQCTCDVKCHFVSAGVLCHSEL